MSRTSAEQSELNELLLKAVGGRGDEERRCINIEKVRELISRGADVNAATGSGGHSPLHMVAETEYLDILYILLEAGAKVNATNKYMHTPLHCAVYSNYDNRISIINALLKAGADANLVDEEGRTPLMLAKQRGNDDAEAILSLHKLNAKLKADGALTPEESEELVKLESFLKSKEKPEADCISAYQAYLDAAHKSVSGIAAEELGGAAAGAASTDLVGHPELGRALVGDSAVATSGDAFSTPAL